MSFVKFEGNGKVNVNGDTVDLPDVRDRASLSGMMTVAEYFAMVENNKKLYAGSGMIESPGSKFGPIANPNIWAYDTISDKGWPNYKHFINSLMVNALESNRPDLIDRYKKHEYNISGHIVELRSFGRGTGT